jgi:hypothetical protein
MMTWRAWWRAAGAPLAARAALRLHRQMRRCVGRKGGRHSPPRAHTPPPRPSSQTPVVGSLGRIGQTDDGGETTWRNFICRSTHPVAAMFHLAFKAAALALYVLGGWFGLEYVSVFVSCILLLAFDFWTVKNVTGRLMVGLRWWVHIREDGSNEWLFESAPQTTVPALDSRIFWWALYLAPIVWGVFGILSLIRFSFDWLLVDLVGMALTGANLVGYFKCSSDASKRLQASITSGALTGLSYLPGGLPAVGTGLLGAVMGAMTAAGTAATAAGATAPTAPAPPAAPAAAVGPDAGAARNPFTGTVGAPAAGGRRDGGAGHNPFAAVDRAHSDDSPLV